MPSSATTDRSVPARDAASAREDHFGDNLCARLTLSRTDPSDVGERQVVVKLDERPKTQMLYGDELTLEIEPGFHRMRIHNTLVWKNLAFAIEPGEHLEFVIVNYAGPISLGFLALIGAAPLFLKVRQRSLQ